MRSILSTLVLLTTLGSVDARPRPAERGRGFEANKTFGIGLEVGEPSGLNGKLFLAPDRALDFGVGTIYDYFDYRGGHAYVDHLWHPTSITSADAFELPFYIGVGGALWHWEDYRFPPRMYQGNAVGLRVPVGIAFDFNNTPLDIYLQAVPTMYLFADRPTAYDRTMHLIIEGSLGIRYWIK